MWHLNINKTLRLRNLCNYQETHTHTYTEKIGVLIQSEFCFFPHRVNASLFLTSVYQKTKDFCWCSSQNGSKLCLKILEKVRFLVKFGLRCINQQLVSVSSSFFIFTSRCSGIKRTSVQCLLTAGSPTNLHRGHRTIAVSQSNHTNENKRRSLMMSRSCVASWELLSSFLTIIAAGNRSDVDQAASKLYIKVLLSADVSVVWTLLRISEIINNSTHSHQRSV